MFDIIFCILLLLTTILITYLNYKKKLIIGPQGPVGSKGEKGDKGNKGIKGDDGIRGEVGFRGMRGDNYASRGIKGIDGPIGDKGLQGFRGYRGLKGETGDNGERGPQGERGNNGLPGLDGDRGNGGEYDYTLIDKDSCKYYPFNERTREMKCPYNHILCGISEKDNYQGYCCKLKLNNECTGNGLARKLLDHNPSMVGTENEYKYADEDLQNEIYKYQDRYGIISPLFYLDNYVCNDENEPRLSGSAKDFRCCAKKENINLNYLKYY